MHLKPNYLEDQKLNNQKLLDIHKLNHEINTRNRAILAVMKTLTKMKTLTNRLKLAMLVLVALVASVPAMAQTLAVTNGGFELPAYGAGSTSQTPGGVGVTNWFSSTAAYYAWILGSGKSQSGSQVCELRGYGWIYQPIGTYNPANGTNLSWTFQQVVDTSGNKNVGYTIGFYFTTNTTFTPAQGVQLDGAAGVTLINSANFNSLAAAGLTQRNNGGVQDLSSVPSGATVWIRIYAIPGASSYGPIDNVSVSQGFGTPTLLASPLGATNYTLLNVTLTASFSGLAPINYQWYYISTNGLTTNAVAGATSASLTIYEAAVTNSGNYYVIASNAVGSAASASAYVQILTRPAGLLAANGDFELPAIAAANSGPIADGVIYWFTDDVNYDAYVLGRLGLMSGSQACEFTLGGYIYQPIGVYYAINGTNLDWTLTQVTTLDGQNSADFDIEFYAQTGSFYGQSGTDINGASGATLIGSAGFTSLATLGLTNMQNNGSLNLGGLADGTIVWVRVSNTGPDGPGNGKAPVDNVFVRQNSATNGPAFIANPLGQRNYAYTAISLFADAFNGGSAINYQWYHISANGSTTNALTGATNTTFTIASSSISDGGYYYLQATDAIGTSKSALANVQVFARPGLTTANGDFEIPAFGAGSLDESGVGVTDWFSATNQFEAWVLGSGRVVSGSQACEFAPGGAAWIYQSIGTYNHTNGTTLFWTLTQETTTDGQNSGNFAISFYAQTGLFSPAQSVDIKGATNDVTAIGADPTTNLVSLNSFGLTNSLTTSGTLDLSALSDGTIVWMRVANTGKNGTGNGYSPVDNVFVSQIPAMLSISPISGGQLQLGANYNYGTLLSAPSVTGPWTPVPGATLPVYTVTPSAAPKMFYKFSIP